jgi:hypothetical protein
LTLSPRHLHDVVGSAQGRLTIRQLLEDVLPRRSDMLLTVAQRYFAGDAKAKYRKVFIKRAEEALDETDLPTADLAYLTARIYQLQDRPDKAMPHYEEAIRHNSTQLGWRRQYAALLLEQGRLDAAHQQAQYLVRANPQSAGYRRLLTIINSQRLRAGAPKR